MSSDPTRCFLCGKLETEDDVDLGLAFVAIDGEDSAVKYCGMCVAEERQEATKQARGRKSSSSARVVRRSLSSAGEPPSSIIVKGDLDTMEEQCIVDQGVVKVLQSDLETKEQEIRVLSGEYDQMKQDSDRLQQQLSDVKLENASHLDKMNMGNERLLEEVKALRRQASKASELANEARANGSTVHEAMEQQLRLVGEEAKSALELLSSKEEEISTLEGTLRTMSDDQDKVVTASVSKKVESLRISIEKELQKKNKTAVGDLKEQVRRAVEAQGRLQSKLGASEERVVQLEAKLESLRKEREAQAAELGDDSIIQQ